MGYLCPNCKLHKAKKPHIKGGECQACRQKSYAIRAAAPAPAQQAFMQQSVLSSRSGAFFVVKKFNIANSPIALASASMAEESRAASPGERDEDAGLAAGDGDGDDGEADAAARAADTSPPRDVAAPDHRAVVRAVAADAELCAAAESDELGGGDDGGLGAGDDFVYGNGGDGGAGVIGEELRDDGAGSPPHAPAPPSANDAAAASDASASAARINQILLAPPERGVLSDDGGFPELNDDDWWRGFDRNRDGEQAVDNNNNFALVQPAAAAQAAVVVANAGDAAAAELPAAAAEPVDARDERHRKRSRRQRDNGSDDSSSVPNVGEYAGRDFDQRVRRIGFVHDEETLHNWAKLTVVREAEKVSDADYVSASCSVDWFVLKGNVLAAMRIDTPQTALLNMDANFHIPDGYTLLYIASDQAVHIGAVVQTRRQLRKVTSVLRHHLNIHEGAQHFTKALRFDASSRTKSSPPSVRTIGNRETLYVSSGALHAALLAAGVSRIRVWSIGAKLKLDFAVACLKLDTSDEDVKALKWRNIYVDIATVHYHDPRPLSGELRDAALASDTGTGAVVRDKELHQLIPLFRAGLFSSKAKSFDNNVMGKTRVTCHTNEFGEFAHLENGHQGYLSFRPGRVRAGALVVREQHVVKGCLYQVATGYARSASSMRGRIGKSAESVRAGLRSVKTELLPALREYAIGGFRSETRFFYSKWSDFVAVGGVHGLARKVNSLKRFLRTWKIDLSHQDLLENVDDYVKLVHQEKLLDFIEQRCDQSLALGVSQLNKRNNSALQQRAQLRELISLAGVDTKWDVRLLGRSVTWSARIVSNEEFDRVNGKRAKFEHVNPVLSTKELVDETIADAEQKINNIVDARKRRWIKGAFEVVRMGGHKTGYSIRRGPPKGGMFCAGDDVAST